MTPREQEDEEKRLVDEIVEREIRLKHLRLERASEVERLRLKDGSFEIRWLMAALSLALALGAIFGTHKWSTGFPHYFREGVGWFFVLVYIFAAGGPMTDALIRGFEAFSNSRDKLRDLPLLIQHQLPSYVGLGSCIAYFYFCRPRFLSMLF